MILKHILSNSLRITYKLPSIIMYHSSQKESQPKQKGQEQIKGNNTQNTQQQNDNLQINNGNNQQYTHQSQQSRDGTEYTNWHLTRSLHQRHSIAHIKRRHQKDRYNIHKITSLQFLLQIATYPDRYPLSLNETILLLWQLNHVCNIMKKNKSNYHQFQQLINRIQYQMKSPPDVIAVGSLVTVLMQLGITSYPLWIEIMDALLSAKYDQQYDQLYGIYIGLGAYRKEIQELGGYRELRRNDVITKIPIIYRNSLQTLRQYIKFNVYNLKETRMLLGQLHMIGITEKYFWSSTFDWFNIHLKESLSYKPLVEFFLLPQTSIARLLYDDGLLRPCSILEQVGQIAYLLTERGFVSWRAVRFIQQVVHFSKQQGSQLWEKYLQMQRLRQMSVMGDKSKSKSRIHLNQDIQCKNQAQRQALQQLHTAYKTIFINPASVGPTSGIQLLTLLKRAYDFNLSQQHPSSYDVEQSSRMISPLVLSFLAHHISSPQMRYTIPQLLRVIQCGKLLAVSGVNVMGLIVDKVAYLRDHACRMDQLRCIMEFVGVGKFHIMSQTILQWMENAHPADLLQMTRIIQRQSLTKEDYQMERQMEQKEEKPTTTKSDSPQEQIWFKPHSYRWIPYLPFYFLYLPALVNQHSSYYSFDENCYFLYLMLKNVKNWEAQIEGEIGFRYLGQVEQLKQAVKVASYSRGFKLQMGTYFYKLLNYVDLVQFFQGGSG